MRANRTARAERQKHSGLRSAPTYAKYTAPVPQRQISGTETRVRVIGEAGQVAAPSAGSAVVAMTSSSGGPDDTKSPLLRQACRGGSNSAFSIRNSDIGEFYLF